MWQGFIHGESLVKSLSTFLDSWGAPPPAESGSALGVSLLETDPAPALAASSFWEGTSLDAAQGLPEGAVAVSVASSAPQAFLEPQFRGGAVAIRPKGPGGRACGGGPGRNAGAEAAPGGR